MMESHRASGNVLVVDDEPAIRQLVETALESEQIQSEPAEDAEQARSALERGGVDVMLLDLMMPGVDGFTFLQQLRDVPALRPRAVLVVSARTSREDILRALELGANDYITKPFDIDDLLVRVEMWLHRGREAAQEEQRIQQDTLSIHSFGLFRVQRGEQVLIDETFGYRKAKVLLKYLMTYYGQRIPKERLSGLLWPDLDEEAGGNNLHGAVHLLRRTLESEHKERYIVHAGGLFFFNTDSAHWSDVRAFREYLTQARVAEQRGDRDAAVVSYASAEALYVGDYLEEDLYEDWASNTREALREEHLIALERLASLQAERGEIEQAITILKKVQREDRFREQACRELMRCLYRVGRRAEAVQLYRQMDNQFRAKLGVEPMGETRELYEQLLRGEPV